MSKYGESILTDAGLNLASLAANGKTKFTITRAASTAEELAKYTDKDLQALTQLPHEQQSGSIENKFQFKQESKAILGTEILFTNEKITNSYEINAVGIYAKEDSSDKEILYAVVVADDPERIPDFSDQVIFQFRISIYVVVGRTENVTVIVDPNGWATKEYVNNAITDLLSDCDIEDIGLRHFIETEGGI
ncbi:hypothetical protein DS831_06090 [Bombilactobacillus bombi]|uniref:Phage tail protein n=1 Tax=Bombilactobacillus bombi TaxID=1303590 RepID=A0A3R6YLC2_9LACO|nr:hypothetical protein [Bombilactobacillus bombi]RHW49730.1 hypothetical protein DS831_06090 [Bombilactobacillus bombi]